MKAAVAAAFDALRKANHENSRRACAQFLKAAATATDLAHVLGMYEAEMSGPVRAHCAFWSVLHGRPCAFAGSRIYRMDSPPRTVSSRA